MHSIKVKFERFDDAPLYRLVGAIGVYVIWDSQAQVRPTYIGEGFILKRLTDHAHRFASPWNGYVALLEGASPAVLKNEARIIECLLLHVAAATDRQPAQNAHPGAARILREFGRDELLRVRIGGFDPLVPPRGSRPLRGTKVISARETDTGFDFEHDWRQRRRRAAR